MSASERLIFTSNRAGPAFVGHQYLIGIDGTDMRKLTSGHRSYVQASVNADGRTVFAFQKEGRDDYEFADVISIELRK